MTELGWNKLIRTLGRCSLPALLSATQTPAWPGGCAGVLAPALSCWQNRPPPQHPVPDSFEAGHIETRLVGELFSAPWSRSVAELGTNPGRWLQGTLCLSVALLFIPFISLLLILLSLASTRPPIV